jgi:putative Mn2+ efflux pump MntP
MRLAELLCLALALSVDAFAVALAASASGRVAGKRAGIRLAFHFGLFQFLMPVLGWSAGATLVPRIAAFDHWVAFALLALVAIRMIRAAQRGEHSPRTGDASRGLTLVALSTAVSLDALAVGFTLALLHVSIWAPSAIIGIVAAAVSTAGILVGNNAHGRLGRIAELVGGVILLLIAVRIVVSHLATS